jgi:hypothetical protein
MSYIYRVAQKMYTHSDMKNIKEYIYFWATRYIELLAKPEKLRYIYGRDILLGILFLKLCISLIYAWKTNKYTKYSLSLLIMYGSSYMFRHYIAILRERF